GEAKSTKSVWRANYLFRPERLLGRNVGRAAARWVRPPLEPARALALPPAQASDFVLQPEFLQLQAVDPDGIHRGSGQLFLDLLLKQPMLLPQFSEMWGCRHLALRSSLDGISLPELVDVVESTRVSTINAQAQSWT